MIINIDFEVKRNYLVIFIYVWKSKELCDIFCIYFFRKVVYEKCVEWYYGLVGKGWWFLKDF